ncbi:MAG: type II toxin-antitoxin system HicA family toxin [Chitinophagaceae bacterium]|nr:type II toxin-antitoxin system HicA family toxin [Chitinophagaceae bacterium]MCB0739491.1 type II toxin-antitoxin system HicA family toxin [Chitinophagaceae bacterium]HQU55840.1 type II toxin-antitoxin system HicA family toxin [Chitinophagaceae bacterium]HQV05215.1 type II toxin-antitoxin system HicA family toxin [Chitinophagaceae bacterium]
MNYSPKRIIQLLKKKGYVLKRTSGSHHIYYHSELKKTIVVPVHGNKNIPKGTFMSILKQADIGKEEI